MAAKRKARPCRPMFASTVGDHEDSGFQRAEMVEGLGLRVESLEAGIGNLAQRGVDFSNDYWPSMKMWFSKCGHVSQKREPIRTCATKKPGTGVPGF